MEPSSGWHERSAVLESDQLVVDDEYKVMKRWEAPLMRTMSELLCSHLRRSRVIEVGFGMGLSATALQDQKVERHTIIEPHPAMFADLERWRADRPESDIRPVHDYWQNQIDLFQDADGIFFDTYADSVETLIEENISFLVRASEKLRSGAAVAVFWILPTLDEAQQEILFRHFSRVVVERVDIQPGETGVPELARLKFLLAIVAIK